MFIGFPGAKRVDNSENSRRRLIVALKELLE